ncbi:hypothetical protein ACNI3Q_06750 [Sphingomonas sp. FW199]|uniref:hypothetical protein n=1 Tax=Sphingomonas sp. FW199 TaxID=3400217 RepID=UPI003CF605CE
MLNTGWGSIATFAHAPALILLGRVRQIGILVQPNDDRYLNALRSCPALRDGVHKGFDLPLSGGPAMLVPPIETGLASAAALAWLAANALPSPANAAAIKLVSMGDSDIR